MRIDAHAEVMRKSIKLDPWSRKRGLLGYAEEIIIEAEELKKAIGNKDASNIKEELGDVLIDWTHACILAGEEYGFTMQDVIDASAEKIQRRKPYIAQGRKVSLEEAQDTWKRAKEEERG
jgi:NTP pyrophosphatase (non-canonical NTP hydrolase)